jgi:UPF0755 protein
MLKKVSTLFSSGFVLVVSLLLLGVSVAYSVFLKAPEGFPVGDIVVVEQGKTISSVAVELANKAVIKSPFAFKVMMFVFGGTRGLLAGDYYFSDSQNAVRIAWRLTRGLQDLKTVRITIPEGTNVFELAELLDRSLYNFDSKEFIRIAGASEGYLFPDTYLFLPNSDAQVVFDTMRSHFDEKIKEISADITRSKKSLSDIVKMASILEEEARTTMTRQMIAGILWKRLSINMPLQVDAAFAYVNGKKDSKLLTLDDLKIDSPYNTYVYRGLPPTPITNPGIDALRSATTPIASKYLFYLSDDDGEMHYAVTHDEHVSNKNKYLR